MHVHYMPARPVRSPSRSSTPTVAALAAEVHVEPVLAGEDVVLVAREGLRRAEELGAVQAGAAVGGLVGGAAVGRGARCAQPHTP